MSLTFKMWLPVIIVSVITIISMIIAKTDTDKNELNSDVPLGEITQ